MTHSSRDAHRIAELPDIRRAQIDLLSFTKRDRAIHLLLEIDVTKPREAMRSFKAEKGESLSFTAFIVACFGHALEEHKTLHAYRKGQKQLMIFEEVDVSTQIEKEDKGEKVVVPHIVRAANRKTVLEIHQEIRAAQNSGPQMAVKLPPIGWYLLLPQFVRKCLWKLLARSPRNWKKMGGSVGVSSIGMFGGKTSGWGIPISPVPVMATVGNIVKKAGLGPDDRIEAREYLCLTLSIDHDIADGAPAARFAQCLSGLIEEGFGIPE